MRRLSVDAVRTIVTGNYMPDIHFFASDIDENGKRFYMHNGQKMTSNGWYDPKTNTIWVDINAGSNGEGAILYTLSHELTHWAKAYTDAETYRKFTKFVLDNYAKKGVSFSELIENEQQTAKDVGYTLTDKEALDEVIANACEAMLSDPNAVRKLAILNKTDPSLVRKIINHVSGLLNKLSRIVRSKGLGPTTEAGRIASSFDGLADRWATLLKQAQNNFKYVHNGETADGVQFQERGSYDPETASIKNQLNNAKPILDQMDSVCDIKTPTSFDSKKAAVKYAVEQLKKWGFRVDRQNYGAIFFTENDINNAANYANTDGEKAALVAVPYVLKRGKEIGRHTDHKGRGKQTITFGAPVKMNG